MNGTHKFSIIFILLLSFNSFAQNDSILFFKNNKLFLEKVSVLLNSNDSYYNKTTFLFNKYLYQQPNLKKINKLYTKFLKNSFDKFYSDDIRSIFFAYCKDQYIRKITSTPNNRIKIDSINRLRRIIDLNNLKILENINSNNIYKLTNCSDYICKETLFYYFILIQHSNLGLMQKNLPFFLKLADLKLLQKSTLAVMIDRIEIALHKPQIYGTQLQYDDSNNLKVSEIIDKKNVNIRRNEIGLEPIEDYLNTFGIKYEN